MTFNKLIWAFKRHPYLYITRFKLLSKNSSINDLSNCNYNVVNKKNDIPSYFHEVNNIILSDGVPSTDLAFVQKMSIWLQQNIKGGPGLSVPSETALRIMLAGEGGVCSDMAQIFNNFCVINEKLVREWGATRAPFNKSYGGHSFNEVYCIELKKWVLVDVSYCLMFYSDTDIPLSVVEVYQLMRSGKQVRYESFSKNVPVDDSSVGKNYLDDNTVPFLICNYSNKTYDKYLKIFRPYFPIFMIHFMLFLLNRSYHYRFPLDDYRKIF